MRVQVRWADERVGRDHRHRVLRAGDATAVVSRRRDAREPRTTERAEPVTGVITPVEPRLPLRRLARGVGVLPRPRRGPDPRPALPDLPEGLRPAAQRLPGRRRRRPPTRSSCPTSGTVTTFCIVNVPFLGQKITPPYVSAYVLLDGADIAFLHLILDIPAEEVRMGMRVEAVWKPREEWGTTIENISHFRPTGEPDADYETYKQHL